ncbi:MAG: hypothetical protein KDB61_14985, partial [Planctomycetes bacterium]|nr:hypothetical protein [Planctomycetota bacterium]
MGLIVGPDSSDLERYAADELVRYLRQLFQIGAAPTFERPNEAEVLLLIGAPETNPAIAEALGDAGWPKLSDQGVVLKRTQLNETPALVIGGGSPVATLWAVYTLAEHWGVRFLQAGDIFPAAPPPFSLTETDTVMEPTFRARWYKTMGDFAMGMEGWGMADYRPFIDQLAKMKFNRIR